MIFKQNFITLRIIKILIFLRKINARLLTEILRVKNYLFDKKTSNWLRTSFQIFKKKKNNRSFVSNKGGCRASKL